jgi:hypothetical protein
MLHGLSSALGLNPTVNMNVTAPTFALSHELYGADSVGLPDSLLEIHDGNDEGGIHAGDLIAEALCETVDVDGGIIAGKLEIVVHLGELVWS